MSDTPTPDDPMTDPGKWIPKLTLLAEMARHGLHANQRQPYHDDYDNRVDPVADDIDNVKAFLRKLDALLLEVTP